MRLAAFAIQPSLTCGCPSSVSDWEAAHAAELARLGALARILGQRLSMHPGQYVNPASPAPKVEVLRYLALENNERLWPIEDILQAAERLGVPW